MCMCAAEVGHAVKRTGDCAHRSGGETAILLSCSSGMQRNVHPPRCQHRRAPCKTKFSMQHSCMRGTATTGLFTHPMHCKVAQHTSDCMHCRCNPAVSPMVTTWVPVLVSLAHTSPRARRLLHPRTSAHEPQSVVGLIPHRVRRVFHRGVLVAGALLCIPHPPGERSPELGLAKLGIEPLAFPSFSSSRSRRIALLSRVPERLSSALRASMPLSMRSGTLCELCKRRSEMRPCSALFKTSFSHVKNSLSITALARPGMMSLQDCRSVTISNGISTRSFRSLSS